ncbi:hypothetical protein FPV67DRAFT_1565454 [Lyophyllum atratum]|nr:hypothetical protein FPV67DRAFT_1565454 [Lyophyllum atratum]
MPPKRAKKYQGNRGVYNHNPVEVTTATTASSSGQVRTVTSWTETIAGPSVSDAVEGEMLVNDWDSFDPQGDSAEAGDIDLTAGISVKVQAKRYKNSDTPLLTWIDYRDRYLDAKLQLEGRGRFAEKCASCGDIEPIYRCIDCHGRRVVCRHCLLRDHGDQPLHRIEIWADRHFKKISLASLGLQFQLGHAPRKICPFSRAARKDFQVIHDNGVHFVNLFFCGCDPKYEPFQQLLDVAWFPATPLEPQTSATFAVLRLFHTVNLQGKIAGYDFYKSILQLTDATGLTNIPDRLSAFMLIVREWRHLKASKRAGRGHDPGGILGTPSGGLAINCRACPQPGINLPVGWEKAPPFIAWLYTLLLSEDANFRLKNRLRSSDEKDPSLQPGLAYFLASDRYLRHVSQYADQDEISHCVGFAALWLANSKKSKGLRATGVGSVSCSRHQFFRPTGTGDLQKGERYANMDMIFLSSMAGVLLMWVVLSYDIACQYSKNFWTRLSHLPDDLQFINMPRIWWKVPKFHLPPHKPGCHGPYSLNYTQGVGRTDGEGVERNWAFLNGAAPSTSQMGPGARHDTLDDFMSYWNYRRTVDFGQTLLKNLVAAIPEAIIHRQAFDVFTDSIRKEHREELLSWEKMVKDWEADHMQPDPYLIKEDTVSVNEIRRQLAEEDHQNVESGGASLDVTPATFIISGLAIADNQLSLRPEAAKKNRTPAQEATLQQKRTSLLRKIQKFREVQTTYMPGLVRAEESGVVPEQIDIQLPSSLDAASRSRICMSDLPKIEDRLREAHASEALGDLRRQLRTRTFARKFKDDNAKSQGAYTRMRALQDQIERKIRSARDRYCAARDALFKLRGSGEWEETYRTLNAADIRAVNEWTVLEEEAVTGKRARAIVGDADENSDGEVGLRTLSTLRLRVGDGHRNMSWIWYTVTAAEMEDDADDSLHEGIRLEWVKARARAERWREEVMLLEEEMRRVLEYCEWRASWWEKEGSHRESGSASLNEGLRAYAAEQVEVERSRAELWRQRWAPVRERAKEALRDKLQEHFDVIEVELDIEESEEEEWSD